MQTIILLRTIEDVNKCVHVLKDSIVNVSPPKVNLWIKCIPYPNSHRLLLEKLTN
jgi:hypothetical protein